MLVYEGREVGESVAIWVTGSPQEGYVVRRCVEDGSGGFESTWALGRLQSRQLRTKLADVVIGDSLTPLTTAFPTFDHRMTQALATLIPPAQPTTHRNAH